MPVTQIENSNSTRKQALFLPGRKIYAQNENDRPGLQDEIALLPLSILEILRHLIKPGIATNKVIHLGGGVSFSDNTIKTQAEWLIKNNAIYYIEPLSIAVNDNARWGFLEIKLEDIEGDPTPMDFWDSTIDRAQFKSGNTKRINRVLVNENYSATPDFPVTSDDYTRWVAYKKDASGALGELQSVEHLPAQDFSIYTAGIQSQVPRGILTGRLLRTTSSLPKLTAGAYEVAQSAVDINSEIELALTHNYGSASLRRKSWYLALLSPSGEALTQLVTGKTALLSSINNKRNRKNTG